MEIFVFQLLFFVLFGGITAALAHQRGRNAVGWFFVGIIGGCLGLVLVLVLPDLKVERARMEADEREKRRLREQLQQERMKNQAFRGHATARLDQHDGALGLDTRSTAPDPEQMPPVTPAALERGVPGSDWYVAEAGQAAEGPMDLHAVLERVAAGTMTGKSLVWHAELVDWLTLEESPVQGLL
ncbi:MAG: DUF4339 domain-containing protein [Planctomycetes bacterium]|nr:DUF4339 domain-containing protein [Planctomycetota bacterium]MBL7009141.1 DUF4339 domain-containing protein [Planctomycetota bacterium]